MSSEQNSADSSVPSTVFSQGDESEETDAAHIAYNTGIPISEVIDHSKDANAEATSLELKQKGNDELVAGHYLEAVKLYSEALEYTPTNAILLANRAQAYIKVENYGLAISDASAAIEQDPSYAKGYYRRASAYFALNKYKMARKDFRKVCALKPKDRDARAKLAGCDKAVKEEAFSKAIVSEQTEPLSSTFKPENIVIDADYKGPNPLPDGPTTDMDAEQALFRPGKLPMDFVMSSIEYFKDRKVIHKRYVARLLIACKQYFEDLSSLMEISIPSEAPQDNVPPRVTVCGDTHGQFYDVLNIFQLNGYPSPKNPYLFNGDFVDRGSFSVEVILTFLLFKIACPECIYLTRGNHETRNMNKIYGFEGEVKAKYDDKIFLLFLEVFSYLPLAATIENKVFVTHGGIPATEKVSLDDIRKIKRGCEPPDSGLMSDLLWSDPQPFPGKSPSKRGVGFSFGPDITKEFLDHNKLKLLVRSHEVKEEGYLVEHGGLTITVFSAPNYCDTMGNKGAFIHFDVSLEPKFTKYEAVPHPDVRPMAYAAGMGGLF
jgi:serine/threonine-protein phosphatase 5